MNIWLGAAVRRSQQIMFPPPRRYSSPTVYIGRPALVVLLAFGIWTAVRFVTWGAVVVLLALAQCFQVALWDAPREMLHRG